MTNKEIPADFIKWLNTYVELQRPDGMQEWDFALEVGKEVYRHLSLSSKPETGLGWVRASERLPEVKQGELVRVCCKKNDSREELRVNENNIWYGGRGIRRSSSLFTEFIKDLWWLEELESIPSSEPAQKGLPWIKGTNLPKEEGLYICEVHSRANGAHSTVVKYLEYRPAYDHFLHLQEGEWVERYLDESDPTEPAKESQPHPEDVEQIEKLIIEVLEKHLVIRGAPMLLSSNHIFGKDDAAKELASWMAGFWSAMDEGAAQWESDCKDAQREVERLKKQIAAKECDPEPSEQSQGDVLPWKSANERPKEYTQVLLWFAGLKSMATGYLINGSWVDEYKKPFWGMPDYWAKMPAPPSPPSIKPEREEREWEFHCWKEFGGGERCDKLCRTCSGEDFNAKPDSQPFLAEGESQTFEEMAKADFLKWCNKEEDQFPLGSAEQYGFRLGAVAAFKYRQTEIDDLISMASNLNKGWAHSSEHNRSLQSQLSAKEKEIEEWKETARTINRTATEMLDAKSAEAQEYRKALEDAARLLPKEYAPLAGEIKTILRKYPSQQNPTKDE